MNLPKTFFFIVMLLMLPISLIGQINKVSLKNQQLAIPENDYFITRVIDCRHELSDSALLQRRKNISTSQLYFEDHPDQSIFNMFKSAIEDTVGKIPVILKINWFKFETTDLEIFLGANFDFYTLKDGKIYYEFMAGNYRDINPEKHYTGFEEEQAVAIIEQSYQEFLHRMNNKLGYHKAVQEYAILHNSLLNEAIPNFTVSPPKTGLYYSFNNFRDNLADTTSQFTSRKRQDGKRTFNINAGGIEQAWAVAYYDEMYLNYKGHSVRLIDSTGDWFINSRIKQRVSGNAKKGGQIGVYVGLAANILLYASTSVFSVPAALLTLLLPPIGYGIGALIPNYEIYDVNSKIDMITGRAIPIRAFYYQDLAKPNPGVNKLVYYFPKKNHAKLKIIMNEADTILFKRSSYFTYQLQNNANKVNFCLKSNWNELCDSIVLVRHQDYHFEVNLKKDGTINCDRIQNPKIIKKYSRWIDQGTMKDLTN